jgi:thioredoxin reductase (NADPH)
VNASSASATFTIVAITPTIVYTGTQIANTAAASTLTLSSTTSSTLCTGALSYALDRNPMTGAAGSYALSASPVSTSGWVDGVYVITTARGLELPTRTIIIAAGAGAFQPTKIGVDREEEFHGKGIYYGVKDRNTFADKKVTIVGGGDSAFDWALNLEEISGPISLVHRRDVFKAHDHSIEKVKASRVDMKIWYAIKELHGDAALSGVTLEHTQTKETHFHETDAVVVNIGFKSSLGPLKDWGFEVEKNQIKVNDQFETSLPGIFAVGDVCAFPQKLKLIATGVGEAATAVCFAKTRLDPSAKLFPGHSSDMDLTTQPA